jgi:hypothetical protein
VRCCLQDFNQQVITSLTIPNVRANLARLEQGVYREAARYFAGEGRGVVLCSCCSVCHAGDMPACVHGVYREAARYVAGG